MDFCVLLIQKIPIFFKPKELLSALSRQFQISRTFRKSSGIKYKYFPSLCLHYLYYKHHMWAATCDFQQCGILTSVGSDEPVQPPFRLRNSTCVQSLAQRLKNIQATSKASDQTACMPRLIWGFAGRTYNIVGNLMLQLNYYINIFFICGSKLFQSYTNTYNLSL